jgi:hypothetical protein
MVSKRDMLMVGVALVAGLLSEYTKLFGRIAF